jgi:hypothetical protein
MNRMLPLPDILKMIILRTRLRTSMRSRPMALKLRSTDCDAAVGAALRSSRSSRLIPLPAAIRRIRMTQDHPLQPVLQKRYIEIDEEPQRFPAQLQIRLQLHLMNRRHFFHCLDFHDQTIFHQQVQSVSFINLERFIKDWLRSLSKRANPCLSQFIEKACFIGAFQQSRSEFRMNPKGAI